MRGSSQKGLAGPGMSALGASAILVSSLGPGNEHLTTALAAQTPGVVAQIGPIRSIDAHAVGSLRKEASRSFFPPYVRGRIFPDGAFVGGDVWGGLSPDEPSVFKPSNLAYGEVPGANAPPLWLAARRSGWIMRHFSDDPAGMHRKIPLSVRNFAQIPIRVVILQAGSREILHDFELMRGEEKDFSDRHLPRGTYHVIIATAERGALLAALDLPWSEEGGVVELVVVPWAGSTASVTTSGTGFFVSPRGSAVTNHHVVDGCASISAVVLGREVAAQVVQVDQGHDVALLKVDVQSAVSYARFRSSSGLRPGDGILVAGFPLQQVLHGINITTGNLAALTGPGGNAALMQLTAPIQPGNSGGPVLDMAGNLVGVVVSSLAVSDPARGNIAQNVNFAVNAVFVRLFLEAAGERPEERVSSAGSAPRNVADMARTFTFQVLCKR